MIKSIEPVKRALTKQFEDGDLIIKEEVPTRSSPDSSTDPWNLSEHKIVVVPPQSPSTTRCPVCRKHVCDLSLHFATEHADKAPSSTPSPNPGAATALIPSGASLRRIIPIVLPGNQSEPNGDLNSVTIIPMNNGNGYHSTRSSTPNSVDNAPVNLSVRKDVAMDPGGGDVAQAASALGRKRRKQTHVPDESKDEKYWARRLKNNEAAKKSRDMRIRREKVIFEENMRLESMVKELRTENDSLSTENKELQLKLGLILDENVRLKGLLQREN